MKPKKTVNRFKQLRLTKSYKSPLPSKHTHTHAYEDIFRKTQYEVLQPIYEAETYQAEQKGKIKDEKKMLSKNYKFY